MLWTEEQGLNNSHITAITKDATGLMRIGTAKGLNTFDGYNFVLISRFRQHHINYLLCEPEADRLWICSDSGLFSISCSDFNDVVEYTAKCR